jgi:hypothetical protein
MARKYSCTLVIFFLIGFSQLYAQSGYLSNKKGVYTFVNNSDYLGTRNPMYVVFGENAKKLSDYFFQSIPLMSSLKGFDLSVTLFGYGNPGYLELRQNYGLRGELRFDFQLLMTDDKGKEKKWTVEPPFWRIEINNTETGHGGCRNEGKDGSLMKELFLVFPLVAELAPGVRYYDSENRSSGSLVIFNPNRPSYWLPVTTREVVNAKLEQWKDEPMYLDFVKPIIAKMSQEELNAPAFYGSDDGILNVNGKGEGLQLMRFNPSYWDRSLPITDIQFLTIIYSEFGLGNRSKDDLEAWEREYYTNNGHINYHQEVNKQLSIKELAKLISKSRN